MDTPDAALVVQPYLHRDSLEVIEPIDADRDRYLVGDSFGYAAEVSVGKEPPTRKTGEAFRRLFLGVHDAPDEVKHP